MLKVTNGWFRNLLCHFEKVNTHNYIFIGPRFELLYDLSRRGHPVIDADMFLDKVLTKSVKEAMSNAYVVKKCLELGYSTWVLSSNALLVDEGLLLERIRSEYNFYIGENFGVLIVKSSLVTQKLWSSIESSARKNQGVDFIHLVKEVVEGKGKMVKTVETVSIGENTNANQSLGDGNRWCIGHVRLIPVSFGQSLRN